MPEASVCDHSPSSTSNGDAAGRDRHGRFAKGNSGGLGNPFGRQVAAFRAALVAAVTAEDIQRVMAALLEQAVKGNVGAARLFLAYTVGKPASPADPDRVDVDEWQLVQQTVARPQEVERTFTRMPVQLANKVANAALPVMADELGEQLATRLKTPVRRPHNEAAPSTNGPAAGAPPVPAAPCGADGEATPSLAGSNGPGAPSPTASNGPGAPSPTASNGPAVPAPATSLAELARALAETAEPAPSAIGPPTWPPSGGWHGSAAAPVGKAPSPTGANGVVALPRDGRAGGTFGILTQNPQEKP
jgi:hypothetical protein